MTQNTSKIGYARVSTTDQDLQLQIDRLKSEGCGVIRSEKVSGATREGRGELETILEFLRPGDELVVVRLDRLGRSTRDVLNIVHEVEQKGASITVLEPFITTKGDAGRIVFTVLGMVGEMERKFIKDRQREGIEKLKAAGGYKGGKRRIDHEAVFDLKKQGKTPTEIARTLGISRMHVYRVLTQ
jgi:DNA invertase Pin-like site-specific DNA recombinase